MVLLGPYHFVLYCAHLSMKCSLVSLIFLKRSLVFPILLFSSISLHWLLRKAFLSLLAILWNSAFKWVYLSFSPLPFTSRLSQLFVRPPQTIIFHFCISFSWCFFTFSCTVSQSSVHRSSSILSDLIPLIYLSFPLYNHKEFDLGHTWMVLWFSLEKLHLEKLNYV